MPVSSQMPTLHHVFFTYCYYFFYPKKPALCCSC
jgi:hypothetical protein